MTTSHRDTILLPPTPEAICPYGYVCMAASERSSLFSQTTIMSLRSFILQQALPLLPRHSFTRQTLSLALASLRPELTDSSGSTGQVASSSHNDDSRTHYRVENVIDTLFGTGSIAPAKALVEAWHDVGLENMVEAGPSSKLSDRLSRRLRYSSTVGEHLVEVSALAC